MIADSSSEKLKNRQRQHHINLLEGKLGNGGVVIAAVVDDIPFKDFVKR